MVTNSGVGSSYLGIPAVTGFVISNDYTVTLWVKLNAYGARVDLFTFSSATGNGDMGLRLLEPSGAKLRFFTASAAEANYDLYDTTTTIADHNWHQLVMTWTRATRTVKFYIDAVENGQATTQGGSTPLGVATGPLNISGSGIGTTPINGLMDYFGVMQYALSPSGVTNLYQNTNPPISQLWPAYPIWESTVMTASNAPSPYKVTTSDVTAGGYEGWNAFDNSVITRWQSAASAYPHWIKYDCGVGVSQTVVSLIMRFYPAYNINAFTLSGSMDDSTYTTLITSNAVNNQYLDQLFTNSTPAAYRYYKINGTSGTDANYALMTEAHLSSGLYFPPLTSDTGPSPYAASASSTNPVPVTPSYFAFDYNHHSTNAWASDGSAFPQWIKFDAGSLVKVNGFQLWNTSGNGMSNCVFAASTDNSSWTDLQTINALDVPLGVDTMQTFTNANTTAYRYYRWTINSTYAPSHTVQVNELRLLRYQ